MPITRTGAGKELLEEVEHAEQKRWQSLSTREKIGDWAVKHQYSLILGSWAASMGVAAAIIMKDRHQTTSQKVRRALCSSSVGEILIALLGFVDCSSPYVGAGIDHRCPYRCRYLDAPGSQ